MAIAILMEGTAHIALPQNTLVLQPCSDETQHIHSTANQSNTSMNIIQRRVNALNIDNFINSRLCRKINSTKNKILVIDAMPLHSIEELHIIAIRIYELCEFVDLFVIMEIMFYPNGKRRNFSVWNEREKHLKMYDFWP